MKTQAVNARITRKRLQLGLVGVGVLLFGGLAWAVYMRVATTVVAEVVSPDGKWEAVLMVRNPGAMGDFSTHLSIVPGRDVLARQLAVFRHANVLVADTDHGSAPSGHQGQVAMEIAWRTNTVLAVRHPEKVRVYKQATRVGSVDIEYESK